MGVPVVTMRGDRHLSRVGASILSCIGLSDLVAATPDDYANKAAALAADPSRLELLRRSLRERITGSAVADAARFTANLERAYHDVWNHALLAPAMAPAEVITHDGAVSAAPPTPARGSVDVLVSSASEALQAGDLDAARAVLEQALALDATHPRALSMLRGIAARKGEVETALALARRAIASQPTDGEHHHWLGGFLASHRRLAEAIPMYEEAIRLNPRSEAWRLDLYAALVGAGRMVEAAAAYAASEHAESPNARAYFDLGDALMRGERPIPAESAFVESARLAPDSAGTHLFVALARRSQGRPVDAEAPARFATEVAPDMPQGWFVLGTVLAMQGRHTEAVGHYRRALELAPDYPDAWDCLLFSMHYSEDFSARELFDAHVNWAAHFPEAGAMAPWASSRDPGHRLRVGYLSADYVQHPVAQFLEPLLKAHDRTRIELFCYHVGKSEDELTKRLKSYAEHWRRLKDVSDDDLEKELRGDQIDILVDLSGHTAGHRLPVLARRVAPVQVTYLGYPNTTGLKAIDYRITDARADPPGEADTLNVEKLVRLPETFLCYEPLEVGAATRSPPSQRLGYITFGSFNNFAKISAMSIALWAQILAAVPKAKMLVKARWLQEPGMRDLVSSRFRAAGVDESRLVLGLPNPDHQEHMRAYDAVDIALDTFPYHGTTTTLDALWMNVPVITLAGDRHASRVGASILTAVGLPQLIARSPQEYVALAVKLARSPHELEDYGRSLRARLTASPLMDASAIARELEHAYFRMWDSKLRG